jgi:hypothetical protein
MSFKQMIFLPILVGAGILSAGPITLHNTGVNSSGVVLPDGSLTSFWTLSSEPIGATEALGGNPFSYYNIAYYANNSVSGWVSPLATGNAGMGGFYTYQLNFDLTGYDPTTALITGLFGVDNDGAILLNGHTVATTGFADFATPAAFTMNTGFVAGLNTISVRMDNGGDPSAFRVEFSSSSATPTHTVSVTDDIGSAVPEPGSGVLLTSGLAAVLLFRNRIRQFLPRG